MRFRAKLFINEIIWKRKRAQRYQAGKSQYGQIHDSIFFYTKSSTWTWNKQFQKYSEDYVEAKYRYVDASGRRFKSTDLTALNPAAKPTMNGREADQKGRYWGYQALTWKKWSRRKIGLYYYGLAATQAYRDEMQGIPLQNMGGHTSDQFAGHGALGYPTQKPEALIERILKRHPTKMISFLIASPVAVRRRRWLRN